MRKTAQLLWIILMVIIAWEWKNDYLCRMKSRWLIIIAFWIACIPMTTYAVSPEEIAESAMEGYRLFMRDSLPDDKEKGYAMMLDAAWEGDAKAANNVGWLLEHGEFVAKDLKGAFRWYERAADQGLPAAALNYIDLILNNTEEVLGGGLPDRERMATASMLAGTALAMGRGLPYDPRRGEELILRGALFGDEKGALTIAQQLEMYPDSFSYLPLEKIVEQCDSLLAPENRNLPSGMSLAEFADHMLTPAFWYSRIKNEKSFR